MLKLSLDRHYRAAIYLRLSREDGDFSCSSEKLESNSISNQRLVIMDFLKKCPEITFVREYCDDGYTGANFDRPDFQKMIEAVNRGAAGTKEGTVNAFFFQAMVNRLLEEFDALNT